MSRRDAFVVFPCALLVLFAACSSPRQAPESRGNGITGGLPVVPGPPLCGIDQLGPYKEVPSGKTHVLPRTEQTPIGGWAVDNDSKTLAAGVEVVVDNTPYKAQYGIDRPDVAERLGNQGYRLSGFQCELPIGNLAKGYHTLTVRVVSADGKSFRETNLIQLFVE